MRMESVQSTNISAIGYDHADHEMRVQFSNGKIYRYPNVPEQVYMDFLTADSKGKHFYAHIRPHYNGVRIGE